MLKTEREIVARIPDEGQWFEAGIRVECSRSAQEGRGGQVAPAVLGTYEVLSYAREQANGQRWLVIRLQRFGL